MTEARGTGRLWRNRDFMTFWTGETVSQFGNQVTVLALPLTAVITLKASPAQMGVLNAVSYLPFLILTLFVGVLVDRIRRRPIMMISALFRAVVLVCIPVLAALHLLNIAVLCVAALVLGVGSVLFEVTYQAYLPSLVEQDDLIDGNSKLQVSASSAQVAGPALGGVLVQWLTAPVALLVDAVSFFGSALSVAAIRKREPEPQPPEGRQNVWSDIGAGLRFTFANRSLRACVLEAGTYNLFWLVLETVFLLYATHRLGMSPSGIGVVFGGGAVGALVGALIAGRLSNRLGIGTTVSIAMVVGCVAPILIPLATGPFPVRFALLTLSFFIGGIGSTVANIQVVSLRQALTPSTMLGRMNASYRFVAWGTVPLGALLGGALGSTIGLRATLFVAAVGVFAAALWIVFSPIRTVRHLPDDSAGSKDTELPSADASSLIDAVGTASPAGPGEG